MPETMFQSARRAGKTFLSGTDVLRMQNRLFKGEIGQWNGMSFKVAYRGTHLTDFQQRLSFAVVSCVMPATVWLSPDYAAAFAAGVGLLLLSIFWLMERVIQHAEVERFADVLDPPRIERAPEMPWNKSSYGGGGAGSYASGPPGAGGSGGAGHFIGSGGGSGGSAMTFTGTSAIPRK